MDNKLKNINLVDEVNETYVDMMDRLLEKEKKYGDLWKERGLVFNGKDQETRWFEKIKEYYINFLENGTPMPWVDILNETHICLVREKYLKDDE